MEKSKAKKKSKSKSKLNNNEDDYSQNTGISIPSSLESQPTLTDNDISDNDDVNSEHASEYGLDEPIEDIDDSDGEEHQKFLINSKMKKKNSSASIKKSYSNDTLKKKEKLLSFAQKVLNLVILMLIAYTALELLEKSSLISKPSKVEKDNRISINDVAKEFALIEKDKLSINGLLDEDSETILLNRIGINRNDKKTLEDLEQKLQKMQKEEEELDDIVNEVDPADETAESKKDFKDGLVEENAFERNSVPKNLQELTQINKEIWQEANVCVLMGTPNAHHASRFFRDFYKQFGGHVKFHLHKSIWGKITKGKDKKALDEAELYPNTKDCDPDWPILFLQHQADNAKQKPPGVREGQPYLRMVVGDEACRCNKEKVCNGNDVAFREFWADKYEKSKLIYLPLGPRYEFRLVPDKLREVEPSERKYLFNFVGSAVGTERSVISKIFETQLDQFPFLKQGYVSMTEKWFRVPGGKKGGLRPEPYKKLLLESKFTLCPQGFNYDTYRMYEAIEAGSIPVFANGTRYSRKHKYGRMKCDYGLEPLINSGAPFLYVNEWSSFPKAIKELLDDPERLRKLHRDLLIWRKKYFSSVSKTLECRIFDHQKHVTGKSNLDLNKHCNGLSWY